VMLKKCVHFVLDVTVNTRSSIKAETADEDQNADYYIAMT